MRRAEMEARILNLEAGACLALLKPFGWIWQKDYEELLSLAEQKNRVAKEIMASLSPETPPRVTPAAWEVFTPPLGGCRGRRR